MNSPVLWTLCLVQLALGCFDILYHHELTERLAWRPSQRHELHLHGIRNVAYASLFLALGLLELHGLWAMLVIAVMAAEVVITLMDFVEEDVSRKLPATERVTHTLLALNYGAILAVAGAGAGRMGSGSRPPSSPAWYGFASILAMAAAFGDRRVRLARFFRGPARGSGSRLAMPPSWHGALPGRQHVLVTGATGFIGRDWSMRSPAPAMR